MGKICIIGGGISGLAAAFLLKKKGFAPVLLEKSARAGGNIQSVRVDGFLIEYAANSLLKSPRLIDLIRAAGLEAEVLAANPANKKRYVLRNGRLKPLPMSAAGMAFGDFLSLKAKLRLLREPFVRSKSPENESVAAFFERRLGREIVERAADPFIAGIYAGNPQNLSIKAAFPRLYELERTHGSLLVGSLLSKSETADKNFPRTFSFLGGVQALTDRLAEDLGENLQTNTEALRVERRSDEKWLVETGSGEDVFDAVVISTPAGAAARLLRPLDAALAVRLEQIYYPPVAMVFFGVEREKLAKKLDGFGFLIPGSERRSILGTIWNSAVFENRAPVGYDLLTSFVGGARQPGLFEKSDEELYEIVYRELESILNLSGRPSFAHIKRWPKAIPQYGIGYEAIENAVSGFESENPGAFFCSNFYKGISVGDCVKNAYQTAGRIEDFLAMKSTRG